RDFHVTGVQTCALPISIFALVTEQDHYYFGQEANRVDQVGVIEKGRRAIFGRSYAAEPDQLVEELAKDEAIKEADTLLLTVPNTLGVEYNVHLLSSILNYVAPALGWREGNRWLVLSSSQNSLRSM